MIIEGKKRLCGGSVSSYNDHRIAMSASIASVVCQGDVKIIGADSADKSFPEFYQKIKELGASVKEI
jgi:3-phosphoshikimate 1-carboxyvinyltransferase